MGWKVVVGLLIFLGIFLYFIKTNDTITIYYKLGDEIELKKGQKINVDKIEITLKEINITNSNTTGKDITYTLEIGKEEVEITSKDNYIEKKIENKDYRIDFISGTEEELIIKMIKK